MMVAMEHTSSPRSKLNASCVLKVFSFSHLAHISSSVLAKSSAGGRFAMVAANYCVKVYLEEVVNLHCKFQMDSLCGDGQTVFKKGGRPPPRQADDLIF